MNNSHIQTNRPTSSNRTAAALALGAALGMGIAAAAAGGSVAEDFSDGAAAGWVAVDGSWSVQQQEYAVASGSRNVSSVYYDQWFTNFVFEARMAKHSGASTDNLGLFFGGDPGQIGTDGNWLNGYKLVIGSEEWQLVKFVNGSWNPLQGWSWSGDLNGGFSAWNTLRLVGEDGRIAVYLNGTLQGEYWDSAFPRGRVGLTMFDNQSSGAGRFDDVAVFDLETALPEVLGTPGWEWSTGGDASWLPQHAVRCDALGAAESGALQSAGQESWIETTVAGPVHLRFWWRHSPGTGTDWETGSPTFGEPVADELEFWVDGVRRKVVAAEADWAEEIHALGDGDHAVRWRYVRRADGSEGSGLGRAWLDQVSAGALTPSAPAFTLEPADRMAGEGESVTLRAVAGGYPAPEYQWLFAGARLAQATNATLVLPSVGAADAGVYVLVASNELGVATSRAVQVTILTVGWALNAPDLPWTTGGQAAWRPQTQQTHDGEAAALAGPISHSQASWIETTVAGPGPLTFWWKVSSESGYDFLRFHLNGAEQARISGNVDWQERTLTLPAGTHQARWTYTKDGNVDGGADCGWVDQVQAPVQTPTLPQVTRQPVDQTVAEGDDVFFAAAVAGFPTPGCGWFFNGASLPGAAGPSLQLTSVSAAAAGEYVLVASNSLGMVTSQVARLTVLGLAEALDGPDLVWTTGAGGNGWRPLAQQTHDGVDAAESRLLSYPGEECWMETTVEGPGRLGFWWKLSGHSGTDWETGSPTFGLWVSDAMGLRMDGVGQAMLAGETEWEELELEVPPGPHTLRWVYEKRVYEESGGAGLGLGWVDQVTFDAAPRLISLALTGAGTVLEQSTNVYTCTAQLEDGGSTNASDLVTWSLLGPVPDSARFYSNTLVVGPVGSNASFTVRAAYTCGSVVLSASVPVTVQDVTNYPPVWVSVPGTNGLGGHAYEYVLYAVDPDGSPLVYSAADLPAWLSLNCAGQDADTSVARLASADGAKAPPAAGGGFWAVPAATLGSGSAMPAPPARLEEIRLHPGEGLVQPSIKSQTQYDPVLAGVAVAGATLAAADPGRVVVNPLTTQFPDLTLFVTVLDAAGSPVTGLPRESFAVTEQSSVEAASTPEVVTRFSESVGDQAGISFSLVFDVSGSMGGQQLADAKGAALSLLANCSEADRGNLVEFASWDEVSLVLPSGWVTTDSDQDGQTDLEEAIASREDLGMTALFDGTATGIQSLSQEPAPKAVIVFTDGQSNDDAVHDVNSVILRARNEGVPLYTIGLGMDAEETVLRTMAEQTGGSYHYAPTAAEMAAVYETIAREVRSRYILGYTTHNADYDGTTRTVTVTAGSLTGTVVYMVNHRPQVTLDPATLDLVAGSQPPGVALPIAGSVLDQDATAAGQALSARLHYRETGATGYESVAVQLVAEGQGSYRFDSIIPAEAVVYPGVEWHLQVTDGIQDVAVPFDFSTTPFAVGVLDNHAPVISHVPPGSAAIEQPLTLTAQVSDEDPGDYVAQVILKYRLPNDQQTTPYLAIAMTHQGAGAYAGMIPADKITLAGIEYYVAAWDAHGVRANNGSSTAPHRVGAAGCRLVGTPGLEELAEFPVALEVSDGVNRVAQTFVLSVTRALLLISRQPDSQTVNAGDTAQFSVAASGSPPVTYQWRFNGVELAWQTNAVLVLPAVTTNQAGGYSVLVRDSFGQLASTVALLEVAEVPTFASALDASGLDWTSGGVGEWLPQTTGAHDGADCVHSSLVEWGESWLATTVTGPGTLTFWWRIASVTGQAPTEYDWGMFELYITNQARVQITNSFLGGPACDWQRATYELGPGEMTLHWRYLPDTDFSGQFVGWLDEVAFVPLDRRFRLVPLARRSDGAFEFTVQGPPGSNCVIQASSDLGDWVPIATNAIPGSGELIVPDSPAAGLLRRFYRAVQR